MNTTLPLDGIRIKKRNGIFAAYKASTITVNQMALERKVLLSGLSVMDFSPVYYQEKNIGHITHGVYNESMDLYTLSFFVRSYRNSKELENIEQQCVALPDVDIRELMCPICGFSYDVGQSPCPCIFVAPVIMPMKLIIRGMTIYNVMENDIVGKTGCDEVFQKFFGGAVSNIVIADPM